MIILARIVLIVTLLFLTKGQAQEKDKDNILKVVDTFINDEAIGYEVLNRFFEIFPDEKVYYKTLKSDGCRFAPFLWLDHRSVMINVTNADKRARYADIFSQPEKERLRDRIENQIAMVLDKEKLHLDPKRFTKKDSEEAFEIYKIIFPVISSDGKYAALYWEVDKGGALYILKKEKGVWDVHLIEFTGGPD